MTQLQEYLFGLPLSTHRNRDVENGMFQYELAIAAISIMFFRTTICQASEPRLLRLIFGLALGYLAYSNESYALITTVEIFSYCVPFLLFSKFTSNIVVKILLIALSGALSFGFCHSVSTGAFFRAVGFVTPNFLYDLFTSAIPVNEVQAAYDILDRFILEPGLLKAQVSRLLFISFHIQVGMGYLGIDFLKQEQDRRNQLVRMDIGGDDDDDDDDDTSSKKGVKGEKDKKQRNKDRKMEKARRFQKSAAPFIFFTAVPYMIQIIGYGNLNAFSYACFKDDVHRAVRLYDLFDHDNHLVAVASHSAKSPEAYAGYMDTIVSTTYDLFNRKLFSLPKVMLLPMVMAKQPQMIAQVFPVIFLSDWVKGKAVAYMTSRIEQLEKESQELTAMRSKVESFDMKNAELLQRAGPGATEFTQKRWEELTVQVQMKTIAKDLTTRTKAFFGWIQRNFVFSVLVDCALAHLIAVGKIVASDIFVYSRAIEDAVDMALMKSRSEAELARMMTQIENMEELAQVWDNAKERSLIPCNIAPPDVTEHAIDAHTSMIVLRNLIYSRGTANVRIDHLELTAGVYALTGANGSGKSTLFRVLMSCDTNDRSIDLPPSIVLSTPTEPLIEEDDIDREISCEDADKSATAEESTESTSESRELAKDEVEAHPRLSVTMPSSHIVEISQTFYWPLYTKPIDWIYQEHVTETHDGQELDQYVRRVAEELDSLEFAQSVGNDDNEANATKTTDVSSPPTSETVGIIMEQLLEEKEDWFGDLSGGQRSKVELVRQVFLRDECPHVLLVDETMAPLDPRSKSLVMAKLKAFCAGSVIIVIYHTDVGREQEGEEGEAVECVPSNDFFDGNIHVENKIINLRPVC